MINIAQPKEPFGNELIRIIHQYIAKFDQNSLAAFNRYYY